MILIKGNLRKSLKIAPWDKLITPRANDAVARPREGWTHLYTNRE
jgi:hypothetical protein